jgi:glycine betaine/proline transport system substrate-binding protein
MTTNKKFWIALLAVLALFASACGDDSDDTTTPPADEAPADEAPADEAPADEAPADEVNMTPGDGVTVKAARASWTTGYMQAAIYAALLRELGFEVAEPADLELDPGQFYVALAEGEADFWGNSWYPGHLSWHDGELTDGSLVGDHITIIGEELVASGLEGFLTNKNIAEENGIVTLDQINDDPALIALYDADDSIPGDGIVQILGCPESWTCDDIANEMIEFAGWDNIEQTKAGYEAMIAEAVGRSADGKAFIMYTWSPSGYLTQLVPGDNAIWLAVEESSVLDGSITPDWDFVSTPPAALPAGECTNPDACYLGWAAADILVTASNAFLEANPSAAGLFEQVTFSVVDVAIQNVKYDGGENTTADVNRHADEWIADNRDTVDEWLTAARAAG